MKRKREDLEHYVKKYDGFKQQEGEDIVDATLAYIDEQQERIDRLRKGEPEYDL